MKITHKEAPFDHYEAEPNYREVVAFCVGIASGVVLIGAAIIVGLV